MLVPLISNNILIDTGRCLTAAALMLHLVKQRVATDARRPVTLPFSLMPYLLLYLYIICHIPSFSRCTADWPLLQIMYNGRYPSQPEWSMHILMSVILILRRI